MRMMSLKMLKMTMQVGKMLEGLCGEATVEAWLWRPPPGILAHNFVLFKGHLQVYLHMILLYSKVTSI